MILLLFAPLDPISQFFLAISNQAILLDDMLEGLDLLRLFASSNCQVQLTL
jgi:hypothetical protein